MNWVKENKFLTGFISVMVIGVGALGYELYSASSAYDEALDKYTKDAGEYNRLRHLTPFPSRQNLDQLDKQKSEAGDVVTEFEASLAKREIPLTPISPSAFQDKLKEAVTAVRKKAQDAGIVLPEKSYLNFDKYETIPPTDDATGPLLREMKAIEWVVNQYLSQPASKMQAITGLSRPDLPEEHGGKGGKGGGAAGGGPVGGGPGMGGPGNKGPGAGGGPGGGGSGRRDLVKYYPFTVGAVCKQEALVDILKAVTAPTAPQFFVLRKITIHNTHPKGPLRVDPNAPAADANDKTKKYIVGEEWIDVTATFDMVIFTPPSEKAASEQASPKTTPVRK